MKNKQFPEKWCIKFTEKNKEILKKWIKLHEDFKPEDSGEFMGWCLSDKYEDNTYMFWGLFKPSDYTEITLQEFKKHILKEETMEEKKIIGYKLVKPEYAKQVIDIAFINSVESYNDIEGINKVISTNTICQNHLKNAGVLDLWFEPIFQEEYKVGDYFVCIDNQNGLEGEKDKVYKCTNIQNNNLYFATARAINNKRCRKATKEEIEEYNKPKLPVINCYPGRIEGDYIIYGNNCAKFHKDFFKNLFNLCFNIKSYNKQNRNIMSIKLDSGVEISVEQIKQIVEYINKN